MSDAGELQRLAERHGLNDPPFDEAYLEESEDLREMQEDIYGRG